MVRIKNENQEIDYEELVKKVIKDDGTFSFGKNWAQFLKTVNQKIIDKAGTELDVWIGKEFIKDKTVIDIGCGSGLSSLGFALRNPSKLVSFDYDPYSIETTKKIKEKFKPNFSDWKIEKGSILDEDYISNLGKFDLVFSWGVLHHTGSMWAAIKNAMGLCRSGGKLWLALYTAGPLYEKHLAEKKKFNEGSVELKRQMVLERIRGHRNLFQTNARGMNPLNDVLDWLGGLPYEVADPYELFRFARQNGFIIEKFLYRGEGANSYYLFKNKNGLWDPERFSD